MENLVNYFKEMHLSVTSTGNFDKIIDVTCNAIFFRFYFNAQVASSASFRKKAKVFRTERLFQLWN